MTDRTTFCGCKLKTRIWVKSRDFPTLYTISLKFPDSEKSQLMAFYTAHVWTWWHGGIRMIFFEGRIVLRENSFRSVVRFSWFWEIRETVKKLRSYWLILAYLSISTSSSLANFLIANGPYWETKKAWLF